MENRTYVLSGTLPNGIEQRIALTGERLSVGRVNCDVLLGHDSVSRSHAVLERKDGGWLLSDAGSRNGTKVNGIGIARQMLVNGDAVSFGKVSLVYQVTGSDGVGDSGATREMETRVASDPGTCVYTASPAVPALVGRSASLQEAVRLAVKAARARTEPIVMINGESGTGKELFARLVYDESRRRDKKFVIVNCAAFDATLVGDTLFGHVKGAFTNADKERAGVFEEADGGTVFLDEIGEINAEVQAKLLRVLQEKTLCRLGSNVERRVDVRVICATNRDLRKMVAEDKFREDLFYRLNVISIRLPPLRDRAGDVEDLVRHFTDRFGGGLVSVSDAAMKKLCAYRWPGNVRELRNVMERTVTLAESDVIQVSDLPPEVVGDDLDTPMEANGIPTSPASVSAISSSLEDHEIAYIQQVLDQCGGNVTKAADELKIGRSTLNAKIAKYKLRVAR